MGKHLFWHLEGGGFWVSPPPPRPDTYDHICYSSVLISTNKFMRFTKGDANVLEALMFALDRQDCLTLHINPSRHSDVPLPGRQVALVSHPRLIGLQREWKCTNTLVRGAALTGAYAATRATVDNMMVVLGSAAGPSPGELGRVDRPVVWIQGDDVSQRGWNSLFKSLKISPKTPNFFIAFCVPFPASQILVRSTFFSAPG